ncbi:MAG: hypothetical protein SVX43_18400 [Cyanobacteriota bacterium]|nr:hypothetical protein [Cyanobacteriota bacterium]
MPSPTLIGRIVGENLTSLHQWCEDHRSLLYPTVSPYARGRKELWIKRYCDLRKIPTIKDGYRDERIEALGERLLPGFDIGLLLLYQPGTKIGLHRDHTVFKPMAAAVNLGQATFVMAEQPRKGEKVRPIARTLNDGDCISFNTKILHGIEPVASERWSLIFWHLKPEYLGDTHAYSH